MPRASSSIAIIPSGGRTNVSKDLIANRERVEVTRVGKAMAAERGLTFTAATTGEYVSGTLVGSAQLASGRFAMMTASASSWCRGNPCSTSASASISPVWCALLVASNGVSAEIGGWGYECPQYRDLLIAMGLDGAIR